MIRWASRLIDPPAGIEALRYEFGAVRVGAILESVAQTGKMGRYSIFAAEPARILTHSANSPDDPLDVIARTCRPWARLETPCELPFVGGWIGYLAYEAGRYIEPAAGWTRPRGTLPISQWSLFDTVLIHDAKAQTWQVAGVELPPALRDEDRPSLEDRLEELADCVAFLEPDYRPCRLDDAVETGTVNWNYSREDYLKKVARVVDYIRAGDIFQANLTRRLRLMIEAHPFAIYERLCEANPATHAAYLPLHELEGDDRGPAALISSSPELFLQVRDGAVTTRPIKGTRPRGATGEQDKAESSILAASAKDRAELNMIIDLVRNDLGRVCEYRSLQVESDGEIEALPTVFHRTATITGRLRKECDAIDLLRATFPGGSVTGAPKVRAMQIINELEPDARGAYCGAIGYIGLDGSMQLNLPIRTMTHTGGHVDLHVGSGVVADSTPEDEYNELQAKAAGMLRALGLDKLEHIAARDHRPEAV